MQQIVSSLVLYTVALVCSRSYILHHLQKRKFNIPGFIMGLINYLSDISRVSFDIE